MFEMTPTTRVRRSPYFDATLAAGVRGFTVYNQMLLPTGYFDARDEYWNLINNVAQWDVAAQRQVELQGVDAGKLAQILTPRNLAGCQIGRGWYVALCNHAGVIINDPVLLKIDEQRYWLSIADSNIVFWARAIAAERGLNVRVHEPDVSPLAVQGPNAEAVIASMFGDWVRDLPYFGFRRAELSGIPLMVARSGWSKQGGFELYLTDGAHGTALWNAVAEAGRGWDIQPGCPNTHERIESGLLSWGGDTDDATNPFEVRLGKYVDVELSDEVIGVKALRAIAQQGATRHQLGIVLDDDQPLQQAHAEWFDITAAGQKIGDMTCGIWSYRLERNIGFALVARDAAPGDAVQVQKNGATIDARLVSLPF